MGTRWLRGIPVMILMLVGVLLAAGWPATAGAQQTPVAVFATVNGQVEFQVKGQTAWQPARLGSRVAEGDQVRAFPGANAELRLPDGSTLFVAENSRFVVTKLDYGPRNERRQALFHLAVGKIRAIVAQAAAALVSARQSNFGITTPTAVAAVRGTTVYASFDPTTNTTTYLVTDGTAIIRDLTTGRTVTLTAGQVTTVIRGQAPAPPQQATSAQVSQITAAAQPAAAGTPTVLNAPTVVTVPADQAIVTVTSTTAEAPPTMVVAPAPPATPTNTNPSNPTALPSGS